MLALVYLGLAIGVGDRICGHFYRFVSASHRWATATLVGFLLSSCFTYLVARHFASASNPLLLADIVFFAVAATILLKCPAKQNVLLIEESPLRSTRWEWIVLGLFSALVTWMMFATLNMKDGVLLIGTNQFSDYGPNTAIVQNFAYGHNFPAEYPHFAGEPIRYHFLFYFLAGNLEFLGLNLAWSLNILSILTMVSMLAVVMALGELLCKSQTVGIIAAALFFFHGNLNLVPFLRAQDSFSGALHAICKLERYLSSGYEYRGETWGIWTQVVFVNQRHFASSIGLFLVVLVFLFDRYIQAARKRHIGQAFAAGSPEKTAPQAIEMPVVQVAGRTPEMMPENAAQPPVDSPLSAPMSRGFISAFVHDNLSHGRSFLFCGLLLGALPYWNGPVFTAAACVLACLFVLFPCRRYMVGLAVTAGVIGLPQILALRAGNARTGTSLLHWGYTLGDVPVSTAIEYLGFTFGLKWVFIAASLLFFSWRNLRLFIAISSLFILTFCFQFSDETLANHKFLNVWLVIANIFVAYGIWRLWHVRKRGWVALSRLLVVASVIPIFLGGLIDLFPLHNNNYCGMDYEKNRLIEWIRKETKPDAVFLTDKFVNHPILLAGRRIFFGYTYFTWGAGYDLPTREAAYKKMFESRNAHQVFTLLKANSIDYVAYDAGIRSAFKSSNEQEVYAPNFKKVFEGPEFGDLIIYKVPENADFVPRTVELLPDGSVAPYGVNAFDGGKGTDNGQSDFPRGLALDPAGNILLADSNNGRIQKFTPTGTFLAVIGKTGQGPGEFKQPIGLAVDGEGYIYVADAENHRVQKLKPDGRFLAEWKGSEPGFDQPRDISVGSDNSIYVVDEGRSRIVHLDKNGNTLQEWGESGSGDGQFAGATSVSVDDKHERIYVADPRNKRIVVFDTTGHFIANWPVEEWGAPTRWFFQDLLTDPDNGRLYASSVATDEILVFDLEGNKLASLRPQPPDKLEGASSLALRGDALYIVNTFASRIGRIAFEKR